MDRLFVVLTSVNEYHCLLLAIEPGVLIDQELVRV